MADLDAQDKRYVENAPTPAGKVGPTMASIPFDELKAMGQALADVRTLDASRFRYLCIPPKEAPQQLEGKYVCRLSERHSRPGYSRQWGEFSGDSADAARHAAAEWVRGQ